MTKEDLKKVFYDEKNIKAMFRSLPMPKKEKILFHVADGEPWFKTGRMTPSYAYKIKMLRLCDELRGE